MSRRKWISIAVKSTITISFDNPPAQRILRMKAIPNVSRTSTVTGKVIYWGYLNVEVEYVAYTASGSIQAVIVEIPITGFLACKTAEPGMAAILNGEVEFISYELTNPRRMNVFILVRFRVKQLIYYSDRVKTSSVLESGRGSTEDNGAEVFTGRFRRSTRINAWTRKQRY